MRKIVIVLFIPAVLWASCNKEKALPPLTKIQIRQKVDSIMVIKEKELEAAGKTDLNLRLKIEVKVKTDSILNARLAKPLKDTAQKVKL